MGLTVTRNGVVSHTLFRMVKSHVFIHFMWCGLIRFCLRCSRMICVLLLWKELQKYNVLTNQLPYFHLDPFLFLTYSIDCWLLNIIGIFCGTFYHFYVHDTTGIVGTTLRYYLQPLASSLLEQLGLTDKSNLNDDELFATIVVSLFMQIVAILQLPIMYGPTFNPFIAIFNQVGRFISPFQKEKSAFNQVGRSAEVNADNIDITTPTDTIATRTRNAPKKVKTKKL